MKQTHYKFPEHTTTVIDDDGMAQTIMLQLGVWDDVAKKSSSSSTVTFCIADTHPTHWCLCSRHYGDPDPNENGFQVVAYPKHLVDRFAVEVVVANYLRGSTEVSGEPFNYKPLD